MNNFAVFSVWLLGVMTGLVVGLAYGEYWGTKDTERRWSEAVARADEARLAARKEPTP